jgi:hypothetical protein
VCLRLNALPRLPFNTSSLTLDYDARWPCYPLSLMAFRDFTAREHILIAVGAAAAVLLSMAGNRFYARDYGRGTLFLVLASTLAFVFFRKCKIVLAISSLSWVLVNAGLRAIFHPSFWGYVLTVGSAAALYRIIVWSAGRYPYLSYKQMHKLFEGEDAMAAENERIKAEEREFQKRPGLHGWLIR